MPETQSLNSSEEPGSPHTLSDVLANQMTAAARARFDELIPQHVLPEIGPEGRQPEDRLRYIRAMDQMGHAIADAAAVVADVIRE